MKLAQIALWLSQQCDLDLTVNQIVSDSRLVKPGDVFVALSGETYQGHNFISAAAQQGAIAAITDKQDPDVTIPQFVVNDPLVALTTMAIAHRQQVKCPTVALTGSNGKTTVKEMIYTALPKPALATTGNLNNHIGVPLSVLRLRPEHRYAAFELGANHLGEIAQTVKIAQPDVALINNIGPAHIEGFGSIDGVAKAKGEIYSGLKKEGIAVINDDDNYNHFWDDIIKDKSVIRFSMTHTADVYADNIIMDQYNCAHFQVHFPSQITADIHLQVPGRHLVANALAAASCLFALNIPIDNIVTGLNQFKGVKGRFQRMKGQKESCIIDDSYNANLNSTQRAIEALAQYPGKRILIMGDMAELGSWGIEHHQQIGNLAKQNHIDMVITLGNLSSHTSESFGDNAFHFNDIGSLIDHVRGLLASDVTLLIKGSRSARMERVVDALKEKELHADASS
ncbi:UDP-N-acetylmuramoyl-tripeptide--D-alanyl-D-alanine ligase [Legionella sp. W05-934-2]|jgi:UDP-N-acetylmuramoyl-tripeptide--D-alanyl-D-alanine ligase|uniref:UDP-N-acetylmuramoyl-tripeptide--D-alanyl-D- alanine ligase n=1 Tax=Legionella sp. W05-934-2 TaxID=1198649 RepID=UPI003461CA7C